MATQRVCYPITAEEFQAMPREDCRAELVRGFVVRSPLPGRVHAFVCARLAFVLETHIRQHGLGGAVLVHGGFVVARAPDQVRGPDVAYVGTERWDPHRHGFIEGAADLAIEVLSPSNRPGEIAARIADQFAAGARLCWVADPDARTVTVYRPQGPLVVLAGHDLLEGDEVLPGLATTVAELFES